MKKKRYVILEHHPNDSRIRVVEDGICQTLNVRMGTGGNNVPMVIEIDDDCDRCRHDDMDGCKTVVRRLTPLECERLQDFPDNWTDIGEWTDSKGKVHKESSDSARYKALGNSIALPFWKWMARRICSQYERDITMGSLFDGIGGFPLAFQKAGATPVWASEIEEFPIAVTKRHFPDDDCQFRIDTESTNDRI